MTMEKIKTSKKVLRGLIKDSMQEALSKLELPKPSKKVRKLLSKNSKHLAKVFFEAMKKEVKRKEKTEKAIVSAETILNGKQKDKKDKIRMN